MFDGRIFDPAVTDCQLVQMHTTNTFAFMYFIPSLAANGTQENGNSNFVNNGGKLSDIKLNVKISLSRKTSLKYIFRF